MGDPEKAARYLTDIRGYDEDPSRLTIQQSKPSCHWLLLHAGLKGIIAARRPVSSPASLDRRWFGYGPYKPVMVGKLLEILRVFYNFVEAARHNQIPGMRWGLAKSRIIVKDIIYYQWQSCLGFFSQ
jgi:hypothetical protein